MKERKFYLDKRYADEAMAELDKFFIVNYYDEDTEILTCYCEEADDPTINTILGF